MVIDIICKIRGAVMVQGVLGLVSATVHEDHLSVRDSLFDRLT